MSRALLSGLWSRKRILTQAVVGLAVGALCLWIAARQAGAFDYAQIWQSIDLRWAPLLIALYWLQVGIRTIRWRRLNAASGVTFGKMSAVLVAGYAVNILLPARLGELFRADLLKRVAGVPRGEGLGTIFVERLIDGTAVVLALLLGFALLPAGTSPTAALVGLAAISGIGLATALVVAWQFPRVVRLAHASRWTWVITRLTDAQRAFHSVRGAEFVHQSLLTLLIYCLETLIVCALVLLVGIDVTLGMALLVLGAASLSTLIPTAPGFVGSLQLAFVLSLGLFGVEGARAILAATALQVFGFAPLVVVGLAIVLLSSSSLLIRRA